VRRAQDLPDPIGFYRPLEGAVSPIQGAVPRSGGYRPGPIDDDHISSELTTLGPFPASNLGAVESLWRALDEYVAKQAYVAVLGYQTVPVFTSDRVDQRGVVLHAVYGLDWSSFELK
jgi:hypothetical protein